MAVEDGFSNRMGGVLSGTDHWWVSNQNLIDGTASPGLEAE
jgi:hypothetical protein